jgi:hypothetical protein
MWPFKKKAESRIVVRDEGFELFRGEDLLGRVNFGDILSVEAYKRDELTTDLICFDVLVASDPPMTWFLHEETSGWNELVERLEALPSFDKDWFAKVVKPAFKECRTVAYENRKASA